MAINYLRRVQARYQGQGQSDVSRGIAAGEAVGKLLGNLGTAIQGAQKNAIANKLMNTEDAPRAALVNTGGPQPSQGQGVDSGDPDADLSTDLPQDVSQSIGGSAPILNQAIAAQQLSSPGTVDPNADLSTDLPDIVSPTQSVQVPASPSLGINTDAPASTTYSGTGTDPTLASNVAAARLSSVPAPAQPGLAPGVSTAGTSPHTGGVAEMELMQKMQQMQAAKASAGTAQQEAALRIADMKAKATGTGQYALPAALKQAQLLTAQTKATAQPKTAVDKTSLATNMDTEPVADQDQLIRTYDSTHGKGAFNSTVSAFNAPDAVPDPNNPGKTIPNGPAISGNSVTLNPNSKNPVSLQLNEAQTLAKQLNTRRIAQGLPPIPVPGVDQSLGTTRANPIPVQSRLDGASIPRGRWIKTPTGQIIQRP